MPTEPAVPPPDLQRLERDVAGLVGMICREDTAEAVIEAAVQRLRVAAGDVFPDQPQVFELTYGRRIRRLRSRFRPRDDLLV